MRAGIADAPFPCWAIPRSWPWAQSPPRASAERRSLHAASLNAREVQSHDAAGHAAELYGLKPRRAHLSGEFLRAGELPYRLRQVCIGITRAGDQPPDHRQHLRRVNTVCGPEQEVRRRRELENGRHAAGAQDAKHLSNAALIAGQVAEAEGRGYQVERAVRDRQLQSVRLERRRARPFCGDLSARGHQHGMAEVAAVDAMRGAALEGEGQIART